MKKSLKNRLHKLIESKDFTTYNEVIALALSLGYKPSNAERRLRPSESPHINTIYNNKGYISGYTSRIKVK